MKEDLGSLSRCLDLVRIHVNDVAAPAQFFEGVFGATDVPNLSPILELLEPVKTGLHPDAVPVGSVSIVQASSIDLQFLQAVLTSF